mmetsp:Transcript_6279/g.21134  ORF Transcript_6279/g.21134 Transcript_6279/m.21134 type:complete len:204 (-) Transcript_6279:275-886(-)
MARKYVSLDNNIVTGVQALAGVPEAELPAVMNLSVGILDGSTDAAGITAVAEACGVSPSDLRRICASVSALLWECAKAVADDGALAAALAKMALPEACAQAVSATYSDRKAKLLALKANFALTHRRYKDLTWRLEVELGTRSAARSMRPSFTVRLDTTSAGGGEESVHLQCDYANLERMQTELQRAVAELSTAHCQRLTRYIK